MTQETFNFHKALQDPESAYGIPERVLADPRLDREGKRAILKNWERNERRMMLAQQAGAASEKRAMLQRVLNALSTISIGTSQKTHKQKGSTSEPDSEGGSGIRPTRLLIKEIMRPIDEVVHVDQDLQDAAVRMRRLGLSVLPVVDGDEIVGILAARDIHGGTQMSMDNVQSGKVRDHLSTEFAFCCETDELETARDVMLENPHHHLLVTDNERHLAGLLTEEQLAAAIRKHGLGVKRRSKQRTEERLVRTAGRAKEGELGKTKLYAVRPKVKR